jgi:uncharacterized protein (TIGR03435 family)
MRMAVTAVGVVLVTGSFTAAQPAAGAGKTFDVVSIHENHSGTTQSRIDRLPTGVTIVNQTLRVVVQLAYGISQPSRLIGLPDWAQSARFDIDARGAVDGLEDFRAMMQAMLADRFMIAAHTEQRTVPAFNLALARRDGRLGPSMTRSTESCPIAIVGNGRGRAASPDGPPPSPECAFRTGPGEIELSGASIATLVSFLSLTQQRPVVDQTGLTGTFDLHLTFAPEPIAGAPPPTTDVESRASILTAVQEQLGLRLEPTKQPEDVLVIDRVSRPTEN